MSAYAANRLTHLRSRPSPPAMLAIVVAHIAAIALVMSARMDLPDKIERTITEAELIPLPDEPPPPPPPPSPDRPLPRDSMLDQPRPLVPLPTPAPPLDVLPLPLPTPGDPVIGPRPDPLPLPDPQPPREIVRTGPRFATPASALRPPYPAAKLAAEEEAVLRLRLSIDAAGRVTAVDAVGPTDPVFLAAARKHLIARWRYRPATEDGRAIPATTVITLRFELNE